MATAKLSLVKSDVHHLQKKSLPAFLILKGEIRNLWRERRVNRYRLGEKLAELQAKREHGTFLRDVKELGIPIHTAYRAMKFFRRVKLSMTAQILQSAKFRQKFDFEDVEDFEKALESKQADQRLKALQAVTDVEREKIKQAQAKSKDQPAGYRIVISLSDGQKEKFKKAWSTLSDSERTSVVYKAVLDAKH
jgi:hypothetical protein